VGDFELWDLAPVFVKINGGPEKVVLAGGRSPIKRTFTAAIGDKVEVLWLGDARTGEVFVSYTDTPAANFKDNAKILVTSGAVNVSPNQAVPLVLGAFTVTAPGTQNSLTFDSPAARQVTTAPGTFTVELQKNPAYGDTDMDRRWIYSYGSIWISVNGGFLTPLVEEPKVSTPIPLPHKASFTARAGDRVQVIWKSGSGAGVTGVFVYRNDRPASGINDTANILGVIGFGRVQTPGGSGGKGENVVADLLVR
jgi:hypothetical protein